MGIKPTARHTPTALISLPSLPNFSLSLFMWHSGVALILDKGINHAALSRQHN